MNFQGRKLSPIYTSYRYHQNRRMPERTSPCNFSGSITIEAALAVPLFFLAVLSLFYVMEVMAIRTSIRSGMQYAGRKAAQEAYLKPMVIPSKLEQDIVASVGSERLNRSIVEGKSAGIHCEESRMSPATAILDIKVTYHVYLPIPLFKALPVPMEEEMKIKGWTGYVRNGWTDRDDTKTVYITETGMVYHKSYHCNYLELSIRMVPGSEVGDLRNESQGIYHPCERCMKGSGAAGGVYITDYGDRYHGSLGCSGLKRTIYAVPLSEAAGKGACSKCGQ